MRVLVWCQAASLGGGTKLLNGLIRGVSRHPEIEFIRVVLSCPPEMTQDIRLPEHQNIEVVRVTESEHAVNVDMARGLAQDCHVVYFFWPHHTDFMDLGRPSVCTFHDTTILDYAPPFASGPDIKSYFEQTKEWMANATSVVTPSSHVATRLQLHFGIPAHRLRVIRQVAVPTLAEDVPETLEPSRRVPARYIIYPANTSPHKNHANLFLAYARFLQRTDYPLVLTGYLTDRLRKVPPEYDEVPYIPWLQSIIQDSGLRVDREIYPLGFVSRSELLSMMKYATALIMPSLSEGGGSYPVEEALRLGTPVLCSDIPVIREQMKMHSAKIVWFDPWSPDSIVKALEKLVNQYPRYKRSTVKGTADKELSWDDLGTQYVDAFSRAYLRYHNATT